MSVTIDYTTWDREDCFGMFDYSQLGTARHTLSLKEPCVILRNRRDYLLTIEEVDFPFDNRKFEHLFTLNKVGNKFSISDVKHPQPKLKFQEQNNQINGEGCFVEPFCRIVTERGFQLKENQVFRLGKVSMKITHLQWNVEKKSHYYETARRPYVSRRRNTFTTSFYSVGAEQEASLIESNPACRYCFSKTIETNNPFVTRCQCSGSAKYIHSKCLIEWIHKRSQGELQMKQPGVYQISTKALICEVCHAMYQVDDLLSAILPVPEGTQLNEFLILNIDYPHSEVYVISLSSTKEIVFGRNVESQIVINQLSVSRKHCRLLIDRENLRVTLHNQNAKFGTVVEMEEAQISGQQDSYQKGRTKIDVRFQRKKSLFQRLGICSIEQDLAQYRR